MSPILLLTGRIRTITLDPASHELFVSAFDTTLAAYGRINAVIAAFVPQPAAKGAIPGADQTALRTALDPSVRVTKVALFHARRKTVEMTVTWLALSGEYP